MTVPERTSQQRSDALIRAREVRACRAALREDIKSGRISPCDVVVGSDTEELWSALRVDWLIGSLPGIGTVKGAALMEHMRISPSRRIRGLGVHQREALLHELRRLDQQHGGGHV